MGGGQAPADNSVQLQQNEFARQDRLRAEEEQRRAQEEADRRQRFTAGLDAAMTGARGSANQYITNRGLDPTEFMPDIESALATTRSSIPDLAENPGSYFSPDFAATVLGNVEQGRRAQYGRAVGEYFTPSYANTAFADTADDAILSAILGDQYGQAQASVERARARGTLTPEGYNASLKRLDTSRDAGNATLQQLGGTVLSRNRDTLSAIGDEARTGAAGYTLGTTFDPTSYTGRAESTKADLTGRLEGDVRNAVGGTQLFDIGDIINFGAREQGAVNAPGTPLAEVLAQREQARTSRRGVGSTGSF